MYPLDKNLSHLQCPERWMSHREQLQQGNQAHWKACSNWMHLETKQKSLTLINANCKKEEWWNEDLMLKTHAEICCCPGARLVYQMVNRWPHQDHFLSNFLWISSWNPANRQEWIGLYSPREVCSFGGGSHKEMLIHQTSYTHRRKYKIPELSWSAPTTHM